MNFKITDSKSSLNSIKVQIEFEVDTWEELKRIMELLDNEIGI